MSAPTPLPKPIADDMAALGKITNALLEHCPPNTRELLASAAQQILTRIEGHFAEAQPTPAAPPA